MDHPFGDLALARRLERAEGATNGLRGGAGAAGAGGRRRVDRGGRARGRSTATGTLILVEGVAVLAGASTVPAGRRRGAQRARLEARLRFAAENGCDLAMICAAPGSASQRNAQRQGFHIASTRIRWQHRG
ncbi:MAG TPA: hypothetical protein VHQ65_01600 [Thermoanaerobaculia bacterium]|nr:hypothetical protein [Thermoanaerobaculia bacterium]